MEDVMLFMEENYIWLIVGLILIVMAIIGYYADKTDFGRKDKGKPSKVKKSKKQKIKQEPVVDPEIEEATSSNPSINDILGSFTPAQDKPEEVTEPVFHPMDESSAMETSVVQPASEYEALETPVEPVPLEDPIEESNEESIEPVAPVKEDLYVGLDGTPNVYSNQTPIPEVKEIAQENDEDVWKF